MFGPCPVVRIKYDNKEGFCEINESDFDPKKHEKYEADEGAKEPDNSKLTVPQLKEALTAAGIAFEENAKKADLVALLAAGKQE